MVIIDGEKYITIKEYIKIIGKSKQTVYPQLNTSLKKYVKEIEGKKHINSLVFTEFHFMEKDPTENQEQTNETVSDSMEGSSQEVSEVQEQSGEIVNDSQQQSNNKVSNSQQQSSDYLINMLELLQEQIKEKDKQINYLEEQNEKLQNENIENTKHIREQAEKITMLLGHSQQESQYLLSQTNISKEENIQGKFIENNTEKKEGLFSRVIKAIKNNT